MESVMDRCRAPSGASEHGCGREWVRADFPVYFAAAIL